MTIYHANITHIPAYWSRTIPEHWSGEVVQHSLSRASADGANRADVIASLIAQLKARGLHGKLRINA